jgi:xylan 1,4-beta-xylosidase
MRAKDMSRPKHGVFAVIFGLVISASDIPIQSAVQSPIESIQIDADARGRPFPHFWEQMFGSGRAILSLRASYRNDLRQVKQVTGFGYVRFHAVFHDEVGVYQEDQKGNPVYNFSYVDQIYDGLLANEIRPFVELSFMPNRLAAANNLHPFWYRPNTAPPKDWDRWGELVYQFTKHVVDRYGIDEVARWYFEVWNEPNIDFWSGEPREETYYKLYDKAAVAIKRVSERLRVGGPSTAQAAWVDRFIKHCSVARVPADFVSTHVYANDTSKDVFGTDEKIPRSDMVARAVRKVYDQVKTSAMPGVPIIWSEYNASYMNEVDVTDSPFMGPWLANTIRQCDGLTTMMSYWTFSDVFEEQGVVKTPFYGGFGLIAAGNIPKASYNVFKLLHELGSERLNVDSTSALATRRRDGSLAIALWNYAPPGEAGSNKPITLFIKGLHPQSARIQAVHRDQGSPLTAWEAMGKPACPSIEQQKRLRAAAELPPAQVRDLRRNEPGKLSLVLRPHELVLIEMLR